MTTITVPIFKGNGRLEYETRPIPKITRDTDVLVNITACGICGTDLNILATPPAHKATPGIIIGHEGVGIVTETGFAVNGLTPGDRVVIAPRLTCGQCVYCRRGLDNQCHNYQTIGTTIDGAFSPWLVAPQSALFKIDPAVSLADAALFEPLSCAVGAIARVPVQVASRVAIIGAGPMGLLFAMLFKTMGASQIIMADIAPFRLQFVAENNLAELTLNPQELDLSAAVKEATDGLGADIVVDAVGNQLNSAINLARRGGDIILFGLRPHDNPPVNQYTITRYDLTLHGAFVGLKPFAQTIQLLESGRIKPATLISHRLPLSELAHGVDLMRSGKGMKVIIEM